MAIRVGVQLAQQHTDYARLRDAVQQAEQLGVDVIFTWDHFFPLFGDPNGANFECWTLLAAWAEQTTHVEIGPLVSCNSYRNPDLLADMCRTVDQISDGRLLLGIGAGWHERDYDAYGYTFGSMGTRFDDLEAALPRIQQRWSALTPPPVREIPVLIGGDGERRTIPLAARHATIWHSFSDVDTLRRKKPVLAAACAAVGRDVETIELSVEPTPGRSPDGVGDDLAAEGVTLFTMQISGPDYDFTDVRRWLAWRDAR